MTGLTPSSFEEIEMHTPSQPKTATVVGRFGHPIRLAAWAAVAAAVAVAVVAALASRADAAGQMEFVSYDAGLSNYQAGGHPDAWLSFRLVTEPAPGPAGSPPNCGLGCQVVKGGAPKDIIVDLPPGIYGNPRSFPRCSADALSDGTCPIMSQVGIMTMTRILIGTPNVFDGLSRSAIYNMVPDRGEVAKFGFRVSGAVNSFISIGLNAEGGYAVRTTTSNIFTGQPLVGADIELWGNPYSRANDPDRWCANFSLPNGDKFGCSAIGLTPGGGAVTAEFPFVVAPSECGVERSTLMRVRSWTNPGDDAWTEGVSTPQQVTGCERLAFSPRASVRPSASRAGAATGLDVELAFPQHFDAPETLESPPVKDVVVALPEGMTINPSAADGLQACTDAQLGLGTDEPMRCPLGSRIGSVEAVSPVLEERLTGGVYVRSQASDDPESGEMFRLAIVLENAERGISVRLPGSVRVSLQTGRIETTFRDNPQLPVSEIRVSLKDGPRSPLAMPAACGTHTTDVEMSAWSGQRVQRSSSFTIPCPGADGFAPTFDAGSVSPTGGMFSPFVARIDRDDRQQFLSGVRVDLPRGLLAKIAGVPLCASAAAEHGGCPDGSRIGTATAGAGAGSNPFYLQGPVYLTEGYNGAPYGLAVHVHAKAGPFDLGWVRVRQALHVDRTTAEVTVVSDPLPQIVKGVPVRLRTVNVDVDRPGFTVNPTSCDPERIDATLTSINGQVHNTSRRFQGADCQALPFKPRLGLRLTGRRQRTTGRHPGVRAVVRQTGIGEAGIEKATVTLPRSLALDPDNAQALCEHEDGIKPDLESHCPKGSIVGRARARTPLLDRDLVGDVYFVKNVRRDPETGNEIRTLPMIVVALRGEIAINLYGRSSTARNGRLVNTFAEVPDAPITRFNLNIKGGSNGILAVTRTRRARIDLCTNPRGHIATNRMNGHNGKQADYRVRVKTPCGKAAKAKAGKKAKGKHGRGK